MTDEPHVAAPEGPPPLGAFMTITADAEVIPGPVDDEKGDE